ncbi:hypothetical protein HanRHA438_Chr01g0012941 [Helianthus annuus]|nr:hypothetical protein HanRHA438_Chr01g0012941 [Helianthus annuus]
MGKNESGQMCIYVRCRKKNVQQVFVDRRRQTSFVSMVCNSLGRERKKERRGATRKKKEAGVA